MFTSISFIDTKNGDQLAKNFEGLDMSPDEINLLMDQMLEEYKNLSDSEKQELSEMLGMPINEIDQQMNEFSSSYDEFKTEESKNKIFNEPKNKDNTSQPIVKSKENMRELAARLNNIKETVSTLLLYSKKLNDNFIRNIALNFYSESIYNIKISVYLLNIIFNYIEKEIKKDNSILKSSDLDLIEQSIQKLNIDSFKNQINGIYTFKENDKDALEDKNLYLKYGIKKDTKEADLVKNLNEKISEIKKEISDVKKSDIGEKQIKLITVEKEMLIDDIEKDLSAIENNDDSSIEIHQKHIEKKNKYQNIMHDTLNDISEKLKTFFNNDGFKKICEDFIKKFLPEELKEGKIRMEQIKEEEQARKSISQSQGSLKSHMIIPNERFKQNIRKDYFRDNDEYDRGYNDYGNDYNNYNKSSDDEQKTPEKEKFKDGGSGKSNEKDGKGKGKKSRSKKRSGTNSRNKKKGYSGLKKKNLQRFEENAKRNNLDSSKINTDNKEEGEEDEDSTEEDKENKIIEDKIKNGISLIKDLNKNIKAIAEIGVKDEEFSIKFSNIESLVEKINIFIKDSLDKELLDTTFEFICNEEDKQKIKEMSEEKRASEGCNNLNESAIKYIHTQLKKVINIANSLRIKDRNIPKLFQSIENLKIVFNQKIRTIYEKLEEKEKEDELFLWIKKETFSEEELKKEKEEKEKEKKEKEGKKNNSSNSIPEFKVENKQLIKI